MIKMLSRKAHFICFPQTEILPKFFEGENFTVSKYISQGILSEKIALLNIVWAILGYEG